MCFILHVSPSNNHFSKKLKLGRYVVKDKVILVSVAAVVVVFT